MAGGVDGIVLDTRPRTVRQLDLLTAAALVVAGARSGFGVFPARLGPVTAQSLPGVPDLLPLQQYHLSSPLGPVIARLLDLTNLRAYTVLHLGVIFVGVVYVRWRTRRLFGGDTALVALVAFVALPVCPVLLAWVGTYDAWVFVCATIIVLRPHIAAAAMCGVGLGLSGGEQGAVILVSLAALTLVGVGPARRVLAHAAAGLFVSRLAVAIWLQHERVEYGRRYWLQRFGVRHFVAQSFESPVALLVSLFGPGLIIVFVLCRRLTHRQRAAVGAIGFLDLVVMLCNEDQTRVFATLSWPWVLALLVHHAESRHSLTRRTVLTALVLSLVIPGYFVWQGDVSLAANHILRAFD